MFKSFIFVIIVAALGAAVFNYWVPTNVISNSLIFALGTIVGGIVTMISGCACTSGGKVDPNEPCATLYVGNISYRAHDDDIRNLFSTYGYVKSVRLVRDHKTGRKKGFGFVELSESGIQKAISNLNEVMFQDRLLKVREAKSQDNRNQDEE